jgi:hypothetical protein
VEEQGKINSVMYLELFKKSKIVKINDPELNDVFLKSIEWQLSDVKPH